MNRDTKLEVARTALNYGVGILIGSIICDTKVEVLRKAKLKKAIQIEDLELTVEKQAQKIACLKNSEERNRLENEMHQKTILSLIKERDAVLSSLHKHKNQCRRDKKAMQNNADYLRDNLLKTKTMLQEAEERNRQEKTVHELAVSKLIKERDTAMHRISTLNETNALINNKGGHNNA